MTYSLDPEFEASALARCLRDTVFLKRVAPTLRSHMFVLREHRQIWSIIADVWAKHKERASGRLILARIKEHSDEDDLHGQLSALKKIVMLKPVDAETGVEEIEKFAAASNLAIAIESGVEALAKHDLDRAYEILAKATKDRIKPRGYTHIDWQAEFERRQTDRKYRREHPEEFRTVPTGFARLDRILSGGLQAGELGLVMATTGRGKSIMLVNLAFAALKRGYRVVYFTLEMPDRQIADRLDARWLGISYRRLKEFDLLPTHHTIIKKRLARAHRAYAGNMQIVAFPVRKCTLDDVHGALTDLEDERGFRADLLLLDSADHIRAPSAAREGIRIEQTEVYWGAKALAEEEGYAIWTSTHAGRDWADKIAQAEAASESYAKAQISDVCITLNMPSSKNRAVQINEEDNEAEGLPIEGSYLEMFLAKYRDGESRLTIPLDAEFDRMFIREIQDTEHDSA